MARKTPKAKTITSRSFTLTTNSFCFDFTWRRVEMEDSAQSPLRVSSASCAPQAEDFATMLKRKQITELIAPLDDRLPPSKTLPISLGPLAPPSNAQVCRTYGRVNLPDKDTDDEGYV